MGGKAVNKRRRLILGHRWYGNDHHASCTPTRLLPMIIVASPHEVVGRRWIWLFIWRGRNDTRYIAEAIIVDPVQQPIIIADVSVFFLTNVCWSPTLAIFQKTSLLIKNAVEQCKIKMTELSLKSYKQTLPFIVQQLEIMRYHTDSNTIIDTWCSNHCLSS